MLMSKIATTKMSSKGQVVIPEAIRKQLNLEPGEQFVVMAESDIVILKRITPPTIDEFEPLLARARLAAAEAGLTQKDVEEAIREVRKRDEGRS